MFYRGSFLSPNQTLLTVNKNPYRHQPGMCKHKKAMSQSELVNWGNSFFFNNMLHRPLKLISFLPYLFGIPWLHWPTLSTSRGSGGVWHPNGTASSIFQGQQFSLCLAAPLLFAEALSNSKGKLRNCYQSFSNILSGKKNKTKKQPWWVFLLWTSDLSGVLIISLEWP